MATIKEILDWARSYLMSCGSETPALDAEVLVAWGLGTDRAGLYRESDRPLSRGEEKLCRELVTRRGRGEPVAYITGHREFMGLDLEVGPSVLIPRPETELMVETALELLAAEPEPVVVDVGTGSGAVAVSLARYLPRARVWATDISPGALILAARNARLHGVEGRICFRRGDLLEPIADTFLSGRVHLIAANLPYIPSGELARLPADVRLYEPREALDGGVDGLDLYRRLVPQARRVLAPGGHLLMEIGPGQSARAVALVSPPDWDARLLRDLAGRERLVVARRRPEPLP